MKLIGTGGSLPYTWQQDGGVMPPGISFNSTTQEISGTPLVGSAGFYTFSIQLSDSDNATTSQTLRIEVFTPKLPFPSEGKACELRRGSGRGSLAVLLGIIGAAAILSRRRRRQYCRSRLSD